jgi:hypothetical protein
MTAMDGNSSLVDCPVARRGHFCPSGSVGVIAIRAGIALVIVPDNAEELLAPRSGICVCLDRVVVPTLTMPRISPSHIPTAAP